MPNGYRLAHVEQSLARPLRQAVLRPHQSLEELAADERADAVCIAAIEESSGELLACVTVQPDLPPALLDWLKDRNPVWRLRSMATISEARGNGIGAALLEESFSFANEHGGGAIWCSARVPAIGFYERAGFVAVGEVFLEEHIGPHRYMWLDLDGPVAG